MVIDMQDWIAARWFRAVYSAHLRVSFQPDFFLLRLSVAALPPPLWFKDVHMILVHDDDTRLLKCTPHWSGADIDRKILEIRLVPKAPELFDSFVVNDAVPLLPISTVLIIRDSTLLSLPNASSIEAYMKANATHLDPSDH